MSKKDLLPNTANKLVADVPGPQPPMPGPNPGFQPPAGARPPFFGQQSQFPPGSQPPFPGISQPPPQNMSGLPPGGPRPPFGPPGALAAPPSRMPPMSGAPPTQAPGPIPPQFSNTPGAHPPSASGPFHPPQSQGPPGPQFMPPTSMPSPFTSPSAMQRPPLPQQQAQSPVASMPPMANRYPPQQQQLNSPVYPSQQQPAAAKAPVYPQPTTKSMEGLNQKMNNMSVTQQGFNRLWSGTMDSYDLMQMRNILPPTKVEPPKINLHQTFTDASNCSSEYYRIKFVC